MSLEDFVQALLSALDTPTMSESDVIVAIDFGTSRTGVTWGLRNKVVKELLEVQPLDGAGIMNETDKKTPTSVLMKSTDQTVIAFGQNARLKYMSGENEDDYFFQYFKMDLHNQFEIDPKVKAYNDMKVSLSVILRECFIFIKKRLINALQAKGVIVSDNPHDIVWVLTVPAIWTDAAKSIMRKAAFEADMIGEEQSDRLIIALEPECAFLGSLRCIDNEDDFFSEKKKFLMVDSGGGTIDITSHEIVSIKPLELKELIPPDGGHLGSTVIDKKFFEFLKKFFGASSYNALSKTETFVELEKKWEECKINFSFDRETDEYTRINMSAVLLELDIKSKFSDLIDKWNEENPNFNVKKCGGVTMGICYDLMLSFFHEPIENVINKVKQILDNNQNDLKDLKYLLMAGGFSRNIHLQKRMNEEFHDRYGLKVLLPRDPDLLIVRGAAIFGANPESVVKSRKAKYTFGIESVIDFNPLDPVHLRHRRQAFIDGNGNLKIEHFHIHGTKGDDIKVGESTERQYYLPLTDKTENVKVDILTSSECNSFSRSDAGVNVLATANIPINTDLPYENRAIGIEFSFGTSEVICYVYSKDDDSVVKRVELEYHSIVN